MRIDGLGWAIAGASSVAAVAAIAAPPWCTALVAAGATLCAANLARTTRRQVAEPAAESPRTAPTQDLRHELQRRDEQLAHTVHELRTPLTCVVTALEMLRQGYATSPDEVEEFLNQASLAARHLGFLINDVLDEAALAAGELRLNRQVHVVADLLASARSVLGLQASSRGVHLQFEPVASNLAVRTDERRFQQVMFNLVGNAVKFTTADEPVVVRVEPRGDAVRFLVTDKGPGVPRAARERLFTPYCSAPTSPGQAVAGTGLGLHVCRLLVTQLGGTIGYEPGPERGSMFWFEQPAAPAKMTFEVARPTIENAPALQRTDAASHSAIASEPASPR